MDTSIRSRRWLGAIVVVTLSSVTLSLSCAQPGSGERGGLTAPSVQSGGAQTQAKPELTYDASGIWNGVFSGEISGSGCISVTQDSHGDLSAIEVNNTGNPEPSSHTYTFKRQGSSKKNVVDYKVTIVGAAGFTCVDDVSGTAQFNTTDPQSITAQLSGLVNLREDPQTCGTRSFVLSAHRDVLSSCPIP